MMEILTTSCDEFMVQLTGHPRPFQLKQHYCNNPDCPDNRVSLEFVEIEKDGSAVSNQIRFFFNLDLDTWQVCDDTKHSEQINALVDEFLCDLSDEMKAVFRNERQSVRQRHRKLTEFTMPVEEIKDGRLVSFSEIMSGREGGYDGFPTYGFQFALEDQIYLIDDLYCPSPKCKCNNVLLRFLSYKEETEQTATASDIFLATLSLDGKKLKFTELTECSRSQAERLVRQWLQAEPDVLDELKQRYKEVERTTKRILKENRKSYSHRIQAVTTPSQMVPMSNLNDGFRVGRNDPCPCGSGKKYKKCCGHILKAGAPG